MGAKNKKRKIRTKHTIYRVVLPTKSKTTKKNTAYANLCEITCPNIVQHMCADTDAMPHASKTQQQPQQQKDLIFGAK